MGKLFPATHAPWMDVPMPQFPRLGQDLDVDVVVVGGGLTGITTAWLLKQDGVRVALLERARLAAADTGHTTAHLTQVTDRRLHDLAARFGSDAARAFWEAGAMAIDAIDRIAAGADADCDFRRVPGFLHESSRAAPDATERARLDQDLALAREFGFDAQAVADVPYAHRHGICFADQAKFHPRRYLAALVAKIAGNGSFVFENTSFEQVHDEPLAVCANGHRVRCSYLVIATHSPLMGRSGALPAPLFQTRLALYTSYVLGARLPKDTLPEALFWDTGDPYDYLRIDEHPDHQYAIFGGADVKTGQEKDTEQVFQQLQHRLLAVLPAARVEHRWMGQVVETDDGLPFIGQSAEGEFIATGFCGNGFTLGTLAALMARDRFLGRDNPWFELFRVDRRPLRGR